MELFTLLGRIVIDNTNANNEIQSTTDTANESEKEVSGAFEKIGGVASKIATGIGIAGAAIGGAFVATIESTREYRQEMGKLDTAFVTNGHSSQAAKQTYSDLNAVLGETDQAVEAANHLALLTDNEKDLQTWTDICTGVYATFGASLPIEGLTEAANETAKVGQVTGAVADALNWAGISEDEFNKKLEACSNEQERQKLIMDTLNSTYSDASAQYQETNKDILESRKAQERLSDALAKVGEVGEPVLTAIKNAIADMAEKAVPKIQAIIEKFQECIIWIKENESTIHAWVAVVMGATVTVGTFLLILNWGSIMASAAKAIGYVRTAILAMNAAMLANPIGLIVSLIAGLVVAFIYLWNNVEGFRKFWIDAWNMMKNACSVALDWIKNASASTMNSVKQFFINAWNSIKNVWNGVKSYFSGIWSGIKSVFGTVGTWFRDTFRNAWNNIKSVFGGWGSFFSGLWSSIKSKFGSIGSSLGTAMGNAVKSGMNGVISTVERAINKGIGLINSAIGLANKLPGINVGKVSKISLPRLAEGGVLEKGQVGLLEGSGAEAVVPLEHNTKWIDSVANKFEDKLGGLSSQIINERLNKIISLLEKLLERNIYLDTGTLVGELSDGIDTMLGNKYKNIQRGNTR